MTDAAFAGELLFTIADFCGRVETSCGTRPLEELGRKLEKLPPRDEIIQPGDHDRLSVRHDHHRPDRSVRSIKIANNGPVLGIDDDNSAFCVAEGQHLVCRAAVSGQHGNALVAEAHHPATVGQPFDIHCSVRRAKGDNVAGLVDNEDGYTPSVVDYAADIFAI